MGFQSHSSVAATVVIATCNRLSHLAAAVEALERQTFDNFEILVVENGPESGAGAFCAAKRVRYVHEPRIGLSSARNTAARSAHGDVVAFIDDDAIPEDDWLHRLLAGFDDPRVGGVTGTIRYMQSYRNDRIMSDDVAPGSETTRSAELFDQSTERWFEKACFGGIGDGSNMAFRRALIGKSIRFDERLGRGQLLDGGEDHVVLANVIQRGYAVAHLPDAVVRHPAPADPQSRRTLRLANLRTSIAYVIHLVAEYPAQRGAIAAFLMRAVLRRLAGFARRNPDATPRSGSIRAAIAGAFLYWRARRSWRDRGGSESAQPLSTLSQRNRHHKSSFAQARAVNSRTP